MFENRFVAVCFELPGFFGPHFVDLLIQRRHHVVAIQNVQSMTGSVGDDIQVRLPHVAAHKLQMIPHAGFEQVEEALQCFLFAVPSDP